MKFWWLWTWNIFVTAHPASHSTPQSSEILTGNVISPAVDERAISPSVNSVTLDIVPINQDTTALRYTVQLKVTTSADVSYSPNLVLDTGSPVSWMISTAVDQTNLPSHLHTFLPFQREICADGWIIYGTSGGRRSKLEYQHQLVEASFKRLELPEINIGAAASFTDLQDPVWAENKVDGILGLSLEDESWLNEIIKRYPKIDRFTVDVSRKYLVLGSNDHVPMSKDVISAKIISSRPQKWTVNSDAEGQIMFDTGAPRIVVSPDWMTRWLGETGEDNWRYGKYLGSQILQIKCDGALIADLKFSISKKTLTVPGSFLVGWKLEPTGEWCWPRITKAPPHSVLLFGLPFFERYITVFNFGKKKGIQFALPA